MSKLLLLLAVICYASVCVSAADTTTISSVLFTTGAPGTCTGTNFTTTYTAGECKSSMAYYCSTDGSKVYQVSFTDASCNSTFVSSITQFSTTCGGSGAGVMQYLCTNPSAGPALPWSFPPSGWAQSSYCWNSTDFKPLCGSTSCTQSASAPVGCRKTPGNPTNQPFSQSGCINNEFYSFFYTDSGCANPVGAVVSGAPGCKDGSTAPCTANPALPAVLPTMGYSSFDSDSCNTTATSKTLFYANTCLSAQKFGCSTVNGTQSGVWSAFGGDVPNAVCTGSNRTVTAPVGVCQNKMIFSCAITPPTPTPGAASSTGASMVAMVLASIVALIASLSL